MAIFDIRKDIMTRQQASKYSPSYLMAKGYQCLGEDKQPKQFDNYFSSLVSGRMFVTFKKGNISIQYGLYIKGYPPTTYAIIINGKVIFDMGFIES